MEWHESVDEVKPHVVQITTPQGSGTGFFLYRALGQRDVCAVATAAHVIDHANYWEQPIRIKSHGSGNSALLRSPDRAIFVDGNQDTAVIVFAAKEVSFPQSPHGLLEEGYLQKVGVTIGWLGFPAIPAADLCFFTGTISAWLDDHNANFR